MNHSAHAQQNFKKLHARLCGSIFIHNSADSIDAKKLMKLYHLIYICMTKPLYFNRQFKKIVLLYHSVFVNNISIKCVLH